MIAISTKQRWWCTTLCRPLRSHTFSPLIIFLSRGLENSRETCIPRQSFWSLSKLGVLFRSTLNREIYKAAKLTSLRLAYNDAGDAHHPTMHRWWFPILELFILKCTSLSLMKVLRFGFENSPKPQHGRHRPCCFSIASAYNMYCRPALYSGDLYSILAILCWN